MGEPFTGSACRINGGSLLVVRGSARFSEETPRNESDSEEEALEKAKALIDARTL